MAAESSTVTEDKDDVVFVIAGSWECSASGIWDFFVAKECYGRAISMTMDMAFQDLLSSVTKEFNLESLQLNPKLTYWLPSQLSIFSVNSRPPVVITSNLGVRSFLSVKKTEPHLNLMLSLQPPDEDIAANVSHRSCAAGFNKGTRTLEDGGNLVDDSGNGMYSMVCHQPEQRLLKYGDIRRRLFNDADAECSNARRDVSDPVYIDCLGTNDSAIIRLADAATPSLSRNPSPVTLEDEVLLREVEAVEKQQTELQKLKGKGKMVPDAESDEFVAESEEVPGSETESDEIYDEHYVDDLFDSQYPTNWPQSWLQGESAGPQDAVCEPSGGAQDIGDAVLSYVNSKRHKDLNEQMPNIRQEDVSPAGVDTVEENQTTEQFPVGVDASPEFDDGPPLSTNDEVAVSDSSDDSLHIGRIFKDKQAVRNAVSLYSLKRQFHFKQTKSDRTRLVFICVDQHCPWRLFARPVANKSQNFEIQTATLTHTCSITTRAHYARKASAKVIAQALKSKFANGMTGPRASQIPDIVLGELNVSISYMKAWYAKEEALSKSRGSEEESYKLLASYMHLLKKGNPGTVYNLEYTGGGNVSKRFKYLFFSLGASIAGIKHMRKVILVDGTVIKTKFKGCLIAATMQDANFQVYPIAFGIVDGENDAAWAWFFRQLSLLVPDAEDLVIVSDRHRSIYSGIREVYQKAFHGACAVHVERNVKTRWPGKGIPDLVGKAARAYNIGDFNALYGEIRRRSTYCADYLDIIPLSHWTQAHCAAKRYNIMSSNIAESWNGAIKSFLDLPIVTMVDSIRIKLMEWFCMRRAKAKKLLLLFDPITKNVNKLLLRFHKESAGLCVKGVSSWSFEVAGRVDPMTDVEKTYYVDLNQKTCTCQQFQKLLIPCCHALAAARVHNVYIPGLVGDVYKLTTWGESYSELIYPVPNQADQEVPDLNADASLIPPLNSRGPGRRRKRRIPSSGEEMRRIKRPHLAHRCSCCHETGHNRATCSNVPV